MRTMKKTLQKCHLDKYLTLVQRPKMNFVMTDMIMNKKLNLYIHILITYLILLLLLLEIKVMFDKKINIASCN